MIGQFFDMVFGFTARVLQIDFGIGISLGQVILTFFTLIAFVRFFIRPIIGGALPSSGSSDRKPKESKGEK